MWQNRIFHLIGDSMADKFRKVKWAGVIILGGFFGILDLADRMGGVAAAMGRAEVGG